MLPHLPPDTPVPDAPVSVRPLLIDAGRAAGHRVVLLSIEDWGAWADLRFARIAGAGAPPLTRRIPAAPDWQVWIDGTPAEIIDVAGRGERSFSNGEVRLRPAPRPLARLRVRARLTPDEAIDVEFDVPA
jgi:hypothetical protein